MSALISHGGSGKSTYSISAGLCIANGSGKFGDNEIHESCNVWNYNREDSKKELQRRIFAISKTLKIDLTKMKNKFHYTSGKSKQIVKFVLSIFQDIFYHQLPSNDCLVCL